MTSFNPWLAAAALAALATCLTHVLLGGRIAARPLLASKLSSLAKHTNYYCWHLVSAALALMAGSFAWGALAPQARPAAMTGAAFALAFLAVSVAQNVAQGLSLGRHPQGVFFFIISALAVTGLVHG